MFLSGICRATSMRLIISEWHLPRYLGAFDYRYNNRKVRDGERTEKAIRLTAGKRLMYRDSSAPVGEMVPHSLVPDR
jgi:hypothetical protein